MILDAIGSVQGGRKTKIFGAPYFLPNMKTHVPYTTHATQPPSASQADRRNCSSFILAPTKAKAVADMQAMALKLRFACRR